MIVPAYYGWSGDSVNERQLSIAFSRYVKAVYVITFIGFKQIFADRRIELKVTLPKNIKVITLFRFPVPMFFSPLVKMTYSLLIAFISFALKALNIVDAVYVRSSLLAMAPLIFKGKFKKLAVVIPAFAGDELASNIKSALFRSFIKSFCEKVDQQVIRRSEILLVHGSFFGEELKRRYGFDGNKYILSVAPGIDLIEINKIKTLKGVEMGKELRIGFIGSLVWWQGVDILVKAMYFVQKLHPEVKLYIVGDGQMRKYLKLLIEKYSINGVILGPLDHESALQLLSTFCALVIPSRPASNTETKLPMKMIEAFALGVPVVITKHKVIASLFKNLKDVLFIEDLSPRGVAKDILTIIGNKQLRKTLSENCLRLSINFDYNKIAKELISVLCAS